MSSYLTEPVNYAGILATRAKVIEDMEKRGFDRVYIDRFLQGLDDHHRRHGVNPAALIPWERAVAAGMLD